MEREPLRVIRGRISVRIEAEADRGHAVSFEAFALGAELSRRGYAVSVRLNGASPARPRPPLRAV
jgi:hypothetical protein